MSYTGENRLTDLWLPAMEALRPRDALLQAKAVARAITDDGYVDPDALLPGSSLLIDFDSSSATASSSDTADPATYITHTFTLPAAVWQVKAMAGITGRLSGSSNLNTYIDLNSQRSSNHQVPLVAGDTGVAWPRMELSEVSGVVRLDLLYRPSAGTATVEAGYWNYVARRLRT